MLFPPSLTESSLCIVFVILVQVSYGAVMNTDRSDETINDDNASEKFKDSNQNFSTTVRETATNIVDYEQNPSQCGKSQKLSARDPRIVGGRSSLAGEFPWAVSWADFLDTRSDHTFLRYP